MRFWGLLSQGVRHYLISYEKRNLERKETTYNGQGGGKPTIVGQRGLPKLTTNY